MLRDGGTRERALETPVLSRSSQPSVVNGHASDHDRVEVCQSAVEKSGQSRVCPRRSAKVFEK